MKSQENAIKWAVGFIGLTKRAICAYAFQSVEVPQY
jgi:hypothetical protein